MEVCNLKRDQFSQFVDVIRAAIPGRKISYLFPRARMNYTACIPLLKVAVEKGFIYRDEETRKYIATDEGAEFVREYDRLRGAFDSVKKRV